MGRYNFAPQRVYQTATRIIQQKPLRQKVKLEYEKIQNTTPPWYSVIGSIPPSQRLVRPALQGSAKRGNKASRLFKPVEIAYEEDKLREDFFGDHPWELARPRQILEEDGKDYQRFDWSHIDQPGKPLDGESVVQRQRWLMGLARYELEFVANEDLLNRLNSPAFQDNLVAHYKSNWNVTLESVAKSTLDGQPSIAYLHLTHHPDETHNMPAAKRHISTFLARHGILADSINRRTFTLALPASLNLTEALSNPDTLAKLEQTYKIAATPSKPINMAPIEGRTTLINPITLDFHRNSIPDLPAYLAALTSTLGLEPTSPIHGPLPFPSPDTYAPYTRPAAYDLARREFYALRHQQEIQRRVAREEALFTGAEFGPGPLEVGMALEDQKWEDWKVWAQKEVMVQKQLAGAAYTGTEFEEAENNNASDVLDSFDEDMGAPEQSTGTASGGALAGL